MEYTITLPDSPSAIACGPDGAFLNLSGILGNGSSVALPCSTGLLPCHNSQGAEDQSSTCPHRQTCHQTLSEWYVRHGRYQRPDVTGYDRLDIARRFHDPDRPWGEVIGMAREYGLSRTTIYDIAGRVSVPFEPRLPGPVPRLKRLLPCGATLSRPATEAKTPPREEEDLQEDQHLDIYGGAGDAAKPYPGTFKTVLEQDERFQEDTFRQLRDLQALRRELENSAYRAFAAEYKADAQWQKKGPAEAQEKLRQAQAESPRLAELHDDFEEYGSWVADAFEIVDLRSGEIRDRETNEWLLNEAIAKMSQPDHPDVIKMSERLDKHKGRLLVYLDWLEAQLSPLRADLHTYLDDPQLEKAVSQAVACRWRLQHEVESMQRRAFHPSLKRAEQELATWIEGDVFMEQWSDRVHMLLQLVQRASSAAENIHSIFEPLVTRKKHFDNADTNLNFVALFVLWHNTRVFKEGRRQGYSPFDILSIDLGERDWRTLLGYPPVH